MFLPKALQGNQWRVDPGALAYVEDLMRERFGIMSHALPEYILPVTLQGTLEWIGLAGWWVVDQTGVLKTDDALNYVYAWTEGGSYHEFAPGELIVFSYDEEENMYELRIRYPGLEDLELSECLPFVASSIFPHYDLPQPQGEERAIVMKAVWASMMWVISRYGLDWLASIDPLYHCVLDYGVAYLCVHKKGENALLNPESVERIERELHLCSSCRVPCIHIRGYMMDDAWLQLCNNCAKVMSESHDHMPTDLRIRKPKCPQFGGDCTAVQCPHFNGGYESMLNLMKEEGSKRVQEYADHLKMAPKSNPAELLDWFRHPDEEVEEEEW